MQRVLTLRRPIKTLRPDSWKSNCVSILHEKAMAYERDGVATCSVGGADLGEWLVRNGLALDWPQYSKGKYASAQRDANRSGAGCGQAATRSRGYIAHASGGRDPNQVFGSCGRPSVNSPLCGESEPLQLRWLDRHRSKLARFVRLALGNRRRSPRCAKGIRWLLLPMNCRLQAMRS